MSNLRIGEKHGTASECMACGEVFCGVEAFDGHRVGDFSQDFGKDGKGRCCLTPAQMGSRGLERCELGRWKAPRRVRTRARTAVAA